MTTTYQQYVDRAHEAARAELPLMLEQLEGKPYDYSVDCLSDWLSDTMGDVLSDYYWEQAKADAGGQLPETYGEYGTPEADRPYRDAWPMANEVAREALQAKQEGGGFNDGAEW